MSYFPVACRMGSPHALGPERRPSGRGGGSAAALRERSVYAHNSSGGGRGGGSPAERRRRGPRRSRRCPVMSGECRGGSREHRDRPTAGSGSWWPRWARSWCGGGGAVVRGVAWRNRCRSAGGPHANEREERGTAPLSVSEGPRTRPTSSVVHAGRGPVALMYLSGQGVVGVGEVHGSRGHLGELLAVPGVGSGRSTMSRTSGPPKRVICTARTPVGPGPLAEPLASRAHPADAAGR